MKTIQARPGERRVRRHVLATLLALVGVGVASARAEEPAPTPSTALQARVPFGLGLRIGYGHGIATRDRQRGRDVEDVRMLVIGSHIRTLLANAGSGESWYHGQLDGMLEGSVLVNFEPHSGHAGGLIASLRYRIAPGWRVRPYAEAGVGIGRLAFELRSQDDGTSFFTDAGAGVRWQQSPRIAWTTSLLWHHISNAQSHLPNNSIDDIMITLGIELW